MNNFVLYALGLVIESAQSSMRKQLKPSISKVLFMKVVISLKVFKRSKRTIYRHLQALEENGFVKYDANLELTKKGNIKFKKLKKEFTPFVEFGIKIKSLKKNWQTRFPN